MKQKEMAWNNNKKLSDLEEVARARAQNLLQRANNLRMEQEEELKDMSKVGLSLLSEDSLQLPLCSYTGDKVRDWCGRGSSGWEEK